MMMMRMLRMTRMMRNELIIIAILRQAAVNGDYTGGPDGHDDGHHLKDNLPKPLPYQLPNPSLAMTLLDLTRIRESDQKYLKPFIPFSGPAITLQESDILGFYSLPLKTSKSPKLPHTNPLKPATLRSE